MNTFSKGAWAQDFLTRIGAPVTRENTAAIVAWEQAEGGHVHNVAHWNPLNTTRPATGSSAMNSVGVQAYANYESGMTASVDTIKLAHYAGIRAALAKGDSAPNVLKAIASSPWGTHDPLLSNCLSIGYREADATGGAPTPATTLLAPSSGSSGNKPSGGGTALLVPSVPTHHSSGSGRIFINTDELRSMANELSGVREALRGTGRDIDRTLDRLQWYANAAMLQARGEVLARRVGHIGDQLGDRSHELLQYASRIDQGERSGGWHHIPGLAGWGKFPIALPRSGRLPAWPHWNRPKAPKLPSWVFQLTPWRRPGNPRIGPPTLSPTPAKQVSPVPVTPPNSAHDLFVAKVLEKARSEINETSRPTGDGKEGECFMSVKRWIAAAGGTMGIGPVGAYAKATPVALDDLQPGDVLQRTALDVDGKPIDKFDVKNSSGKIISHPHTLIISKVLGKGKYEIIESNYLGDGRVTSTPPGPKGHTRSSWSPIEDQKRFPEWTWEWRAYRFDPAVPR